MKFSKSAVGGTVEILASDNFVAVPIHVTETTAVMAGTPLTIGGKKSADGTDAAGILLHDVNPAENPNGALVVQGVIDKTKAEANSGVTLDATALKTAVPGVILRENIGTNT